jgi:hypothetical protein
MRKITGALLGVFLLAGTATAASGQETTVTRDGFSWNERVAPGAWLRIHNFSGSIEVRESTGPVAEVRGELRASNGRLPEVSFDVVRDGDNVTICAMPAGNSTCTADGLRTRGSTRQRGSVAFTVHLPRGVKVQTTSGSGSIVIHSASEDAVATTGSGGVRIGRTTGSVRVTTGSGSVEVNEAGGPVTATTGSGGIRVTTSGGPVSATTGSGNIDVRILALRAPEDMSFRTGSGGITVRLPANFQGAIDASTGSGGVTTDFPVTIEGTARSGRLRGRIGDGGPTVRLAAGSGSIRLLRAD